MLVVRDSYRVWAVAERTEAAGDGRPHCIGTSRPRKAGHQDIGALADSQCHHWL
jgi:hypothetical protein